MNEGNALFHLMFAAQAEAARANANQRMLDWAAAFDAWLDERKGRSPRARRLALSTWKEFLARTHQPPWEAQSADIYAYIDWMRQAGRSPVAMGSALTELSLFYDFAAGRLADAEWNGNPLANVERPKRARFVELSFLDAGQARALLAAVRQEDTPLRLRDYALILTLLTGPLRYSEVRRLQSGELTSLGGVVWVKRKPLAEGGIAGGGQAQLAPEAVAAIDASLRASGRLETLRPADYLFPPLAFVFNPIPLERPEAWASGRPVGNRTLVKRLHAYAAAAGLETAAVNWHTLRNTAIYLRAEAGDSDRDIQTFFGFTGEENTRRLVRFLMEAAKPVRWQAEAAAEPAKPPGAGHGFYTTAFSAPEIDLLDGAAPSGVVSEVTALRVVMLRALQKAVELDNPSELLRLLDSVSAATQRMAGALKVQRELDGAPQDDLQAALDQVTRDILREKGWD